MKYLIIPLIVIILLIGQSAFANSNGDIKGALGLSLHEKMGNTVGFPKPERSQWDNSLEWVLRADFQTDLGPAEVEMRVISMNSLINGLCFTFFEGSKEAGKVKETAQYLVSVMRSIYADCEIQIDEDKGQYGCLCFSDKDGDIAELCWDFNTGDLWLDYYTADMSIAIYAFLESYESEGE